MAGIIANKFVRKSDRLDYSRSIFKYEKRHSTNLLSGYIVPVHTQFLYPGTSPNWNFGCVIESAPLISTNLDNIYVDIVSIWCPLRLVMTDWNEFLGESHSQAFTINRNITIPKLTQVVVEDDLKTNTAMSRAYYAEHYIGPHVGLRVHNDFDVSNVNDGSLFKKGISVLPSRVYELNWNTFFRNENIQQPILIDKTSTVGSHDSYWYATGLGYLQQANKLKTWYSVATPAPSLLDVSLGLGDTFLPVVAAGTNPDYWLRVKNGQNFTGISSLAPSMFGGTNLDTADKTAYLGSVMSPSGSSTIEPYLKANTAALTVNKMYYALMEQRFANKLMKGRRAVEFYQNFFGVTDSEAGHDMPQLLCQKRFPLNISQVIATGSGTNAASQSSDLGQRGAFSTTGFGDSLVKNFTATEHGYIQTYMIIRGQPSIATGIDHFLGIDSLLDTYILDFDHIGPVGIDSLELMDVVNALYFGYTNAWYAERNQVSDVVGIIEPDEPLAYKTLAQLYGGTGFTGVVISDAWLRHDQRIIDRIFTFPVCYGTPNATGYDEFGEPLASNRYQFITQFVVKGDFAAVMSPDSEPLKLRL